MTIECTEIRVTSDGVKVSTKVLKPGETVPLEDISINLKPGEIPTYDAMGVCTSDRITFRVMRAGIKKEDSDEQAYQEEQTFRGSLEEEEINKAKLLFVETKDSTSEPIYKLYTWKS